jgi:glycosyltransferase involved in cell wall biosynthesis
MARSADEASPSSDFSISVVIPLYNKEKSIGATIRSVLSQSRRPEEIVVVDDGSTDHSLRLAKEALGEAAGIACKVVAQENAGVSAARNAGARESTGRFIALLDGDDEWLPDYLAEIERLARSFPAATVLTTRHGTMRADGSISSEPTRLPPGFFGLLERPLVRLRKGRGLINSSSVAIRRDAWERTGGFPLGGRQGEDVFVWLKLGLSETYAHSGALLSVVHLEHSEADSRKDVPGYHFSYFLGTREGRRFLANRDLRTYLASHLARRIFFRRLAGHSEVQQELRELASALPIVPRLACWLASCAPLPLVRTVQHLRMNFPAGNARRAP